MLKITRLLKLASKAFRIDGNKIVGSDDNRANGTVVNLFKNKKSRKSMYVLNIRVIEKSYFLTPNAKKAFNHLRLTFIKAPIF